MKRKGRVFVISAPSGSGKTTIASRAVRKLKNISPSISFTTRRPRQGESDKKDYYYVSKLEFKKAIKKKKLLEWASNYGYYYGTPKRPVFDKTKKGKDVLLSIDVKGAMQVKRKMPQSILVFIKPPSVDELKRRLDGRNSDTKSEIKKRLKIAKKELSYIPKYDHVITNDKLENAVKKLVSLIKKERKTVR